MAKLPQAFIAISVIAVICACGGSQTPVPRIILSSATESQLGGAGSSCWNGKCIDMVGTELAPRPIRVNASTTLQLNFSHLGIPTDAHYALYHYDQAVMMNGPGGKPWIVPGSDQFLDQGSLPSTKVTDLPLSVPPGHYVLTVFAVIKTSTGHTKGDTIQGFNLDVEP